MTSVRAIRFDRLGGPEALHIADREPGEVSPEVARAFPFAEAVEAGRYLGSNAQVGKVVITLRAAADAAGAASRSQP